ncbi:MAG: hypothetical protein WC554_14550 [Clostridia bacterium]|jgi:hypothetical protein
MENILVFCVIITLIVSLFVLLICNVFYKKQFKCNIFESFEQCWTKREACKKEVCQKFKNLLFEICDKESIYIKFYNDEYQLNDVTVKYSETGERNLVDSKGNTVFDGNLATGKYVYLKKECDTPEKRVQRQLPKIQLRKNEDVTWTLAHELGHHFTIQYKGIETELAADHYVKTLAEQLLTKKEQELLEIEIRVYSHINEKE